MIVTSTNRALTSLGTPVTSRFSAGHSPWAAFGSPPDSPDDAGADAVAEELGDLPVASAQAAAVISSDHIDYARYPPGFGPCRPR